MCTAPASVSGVPSSDVLLKLLNLAADPQQAGQAVAEEVRRLSAARCVALVRNRSDGACDVAAHPEGERTLLERPAIAAFLRRTPDWAGSVSWQAADAASDVAQMLRAERLANCLVVPIAVGEAGHGALVVLDSSCGDLASLSGSVEALARLYALILSNESLLQTPRLRVDERQLHMSMRALENFGESFYWLDLDGRILYVNPAAERELGYSAAELRRMRVSDIDPNSPPEFWGRDGELARRRRAGGLHNFVTRHRHRDGHLIPVEITSAPFEYDGELYSLAICRDISARLAAEEALRESEQKFRSITAAAQDAIIIMDTEGRISYWNAAAETIFGYVAAEVLGAKLHAVLAPARFHEASRVGLAHFCTSGEGAAVNKTLVLTAQRKDGTAFLMELSLAAARVGDGWNAVGIVRDITERLAAEKALRDSEAKFSAMFSLTPDPMALTRLRDSVLLEVSTSYAEYFGYARGEMLGRSTQPADLGLWADAEQRRQWRERMERDGEVLGFETPLRRKDDTLAIALISGRIIDVGGERCVIVVLRDITQRKQMEQLLRREKAEQAELIRKLEEARNQLLQAEKLAAIGQLAAGVAHEINNPMGFIRSNLGTLNDYAGQLLNLVAAYERADAVLQDHPQLRDGIARAKRDADLAFLAGDLPNLIAESIGGADQVRRIVQDLRDFSRIDAAEWQPSDIHAGIESTINVVSNELKYKADLVRDYGVLPPVECIPARLNQVFMNILVNAAQAMEERGKIAIRTRCLGDEVEIAFADTGHGIPAGVLAKVFDPFFTTKPVGKGTGLGLSVSYGIVRNHGGRIDVASEPGRGTTFTIRLPVRRASRAADAPEVVAAAAGPAP